MSYISNPGLRSARRTTRGLKTLVAEMNKDPNYKPLDLPKPKKRDDEGDMFDYSYDDYLRENA